MGLRSIFASRRGLRAQDDIPVQFVLQKRPVATTSLGEYTHGVSSSRPLTALPKTPYPAALAHTNDISNERRASRRLPSSKPKSQHGSKNRRSWFGGKPDTKNLPAVPKLVYAGSQQPILLGDEFPQQACDTSLQRLSIGRNLSRQWKRLDNEVETTSRRPWFSTNRQTLVTEATPPVASVPFTLEHTNQPMSSVLPAEKRLIRPGSTKSVSTAKRMSRSLWASSNPDDSDSDIPPVPALVRGGSPEARSHGSIEEAEHARSQKERRKPAGIRERNQAHLVSASTTRTYRPKSAAKGFLNSTNGASEAVRKSYRRSLRLDDAADLVCLNDEQQAEWERLMNLATGYEKQMSRVHASEVGSIDENDHGKNKYSNAQALAALEFGLRT